MKLELSEEWCMQAAKREGDSSIGACSPEIAARARELATAKGHRDVDHLIVCTNGASVPVWQFYIDAAAAELLT